MIRKRVDGRAPTQLRPVKVTRHFISHAEGSVLYEMGNTRVVCTASIEPRVPAFLRDSGQGWITAEYSMIPRATTTRTIRESTVGRVGGRTHEIQRLIGRALRSVVDLKSLGETTIFLDCDVLQADGGTRTAAITGSFIALYDALTLLGKQRELPGVPIEEFVAAASVGIVDDSMCLDLNFDEDSGAQVDMNVVMTESGRIIEVQGTAEKSPFTRGQMDGMIDLATRGIKELVKIQKKALGLKR